MPSNSKGTGKTKRKRTGQSAVNKAKKDKEKKLKKRRKKKTREEKHEAAMNAAEQIEQNVEEPTVTTAVVPVQLVTREELEKLTRENSIALNPMLLNASLQKDFEMCNQRAADLYSLHQYLFDPANQCQFDEKTLVTLYSVGVKDHHAQMNAKLKIAEMSEKARVIRDTEKYFNEQKKQKEIEAEDTSHTSEIIQALLSESMRHALDDELNKKWGGSNSYRPPENTDYEILSVDPDAEDA